MLEVGKDYKQQDEMGFKWNLEDEESKLLIDEKKWTAYYNKSSFIIMSNESSPTWDQNSNFSYLICTW